MKNLSQTIELNATTDLRQAVSGLLRERLAHGVGALCGLWSGTARGHDGPTAPRLAGRMDWGDADTPDHQVTLLELSTHGCRLRIPAECEPAEHMHEIGELRLEPGYGETLRLYGTVVRVEPDTVRLDGGGLLADFSFTAVDRDTRDRLSHYVDRYARSVKP